MPGGLGDRGEGGTKGRRRGGGERDEEEERPTGIVYAIHIVIPLGGLSPFVNRLALNPSFAFVFFLRSFYSRDFQIFITGPGIVCFAILFPSDQRRGKKWFLDERTCEFFWPAGKYIFYFLKRFSSFCLSPDYIGILLRKLPLRFQT